jgi:hypothetical protein
VCVNLTVPLGSVSDALEGKDDEAAEELDDLGECEDSARRVLDILKGGGKDVYREALTALNDATREWWDEAVASGHEDAGENEEPYRKNASGLRRFLESEALSWYARRQKEIENRPFIRAQAFGEALDPPPSGSASRCNAARASASDILYRRSVSTEGSTALQSTSD